MTESNCITLILRSKDRLNKASTTPASYALDLAGALTGFNSFVARANESDLFALYLDCVNIQAYNNAATSTLHRRSLIPIEAYNGQTAATTGFYQLCMDFNTPNKRMSGGSSDAMFYLTSDVANHTDLNTELTHRNPIVVAKSSLTNILNVRILDDNDAQITPVLKPVAGNTTASTPPIYLEHTIKLTIKPIVKHF